MTVTFEASRSKDISFVVCLLAVLISVGVASADIAFVRFSTHALNGCRNNFQHEPKLPAVLKLRGGALEILGYQPAPLEKCREWLEATTFDGSPIESAFTSGWSSENVSMETKLWMAAEMGDGRAVANLVAAGVDVNACNAFGQTALHKVAQCAHENLWCMSVLIGLGANLLARDTNGSTPLDYARMAVEWGGPPEPLFMLEQAVSTLSPKDGKELALLPAMNGHDVEQLLGDQSAWMDIHKGTDLPLSQAEFMRLEREMGAAEPREDAAARAAKGGAVKKAKKRHKYGSARERWKDLKDRRRKRAAALRPDAAGASA